MHACRKECCEFYLKRQFKIHLISKCHYICLIHCFSLIKKIFFTFFFWLLYGLYVIIHNVYSQRPEKLWHSFEWGGRISFLLVCCFLSLYSFLFFFWCFRFLSYINPHMLVFCLILKLANYQPKRSCCCIHFLMCRWHDPFEIIFHRCHFYYLA